MQSLLTDIFSQDFSKCGTTEAFHAAFFAKALTLADLRQAHDIITKQSINVNGKTIGSALRIPGKTPGKPFAILAQLHGNEPAGLAGILLAMALSQTKQLEHDVIGIIGNPLAAAQYFEAWAKDPHARQETRDAYRCGLSKDGVLLPDMNRIPVDFRTREPSDHHTKRAQELYAIGQHIDGILDIHSARGNMVCITDHKRDSDLKHSPIRSVMTELAEAISVHASSTVQVQTLKTIFGTLFDLESQTGIEAGRHEAPEAPHNAASFTLSLLHTIGCTAIAPLYNKEDGIFTRYAVQPRITYDDLSHVDTLLAHDHIYMAKRCHALASVPARSDMLIVKNGTDYTLQSINEFTTKPAGSLEYAIYQYDEMEAIEQGEVVAVALPSGTAFTAAFGFSGIFLSKSAALYDKDPAVGPWPVTADNRAKIKFCYPCQVSSMTIPFV